MPERENPKLRRALPFLTLLIVAAVLYDGFVFYSRWRSSQDAEQERQKTEAERARKTIEMLGGDQLKILSFYANPPVIESGAKSLVCFGVNAAKSVRIEPPVEELHPALSRCFHVAPSRSTEYKLIAEDGSGHSVSQTLSIRVSQ